MVKFKAAILVEFGKIVVDEISVFEKLNVGQVLVKVNVSGICGAQIGEIFGARGHDPYLPHLLGHEGGGVVVDVGLGVLKVKPGDNVVMHWRKGSGIEASPPKYKWKDKVIGGGWITTFNEYAIISENRLTVVDKSVPFEVSALMGCAITTAFGIIDNEVRLKLGESVAVLGCGGVGLNVIQAADLSGAEPIIALDKYDHKLLSACKFGATHKICTVGTDFRKLVMEVSGNGVDAFIECTGVPELITKALDVVKPAGGRLILVGQPRYDQDVIFPKMRRNYCGKVIMDSQGGMVNPDVDIPRYVRLYQSNKLNASEIITHRFPLDRIDEAISIVRSGEAGRCVLVM